MLVFYILDFVLVNWRHSTISNIEAPGRSYEGLEAVIIERPHEDTFLEQILPLRLEDTFSDHLHSNHVLLIKSIHKCTSRRVQEL